MAKKKKPIVTENDFIRAMSVFNDPDNQQYFSDDVQELVREIAGLSEDGINEEEAEGFLAAAKQLKSASKNFSGDIKGAAADVLAFAEKRAETAEQGVQKEAKQGTKLDERVVDLETENAFISRDRDQLVSELTAANIANAEISAAYEELLHSAGRTEPDLNSIEEAKRANKNYINLKRVFGTETEKRRRAEGHIRALKSEAANAKREALIAKAVAGKAAAEVVATKKENKFRGKVIVVTSLLVVAAIATALIGTTSMFKKAKKIQSEYNDYRTAYTVTADEKTSLEDNIAGLNDAIAGKDKNIAGLNDVIAGKDKDIAGLNDTIADKDKEIAGKDKEIADKDKTIADKTNEIDKKNKEIKDLKDENQALKDELDGYKNPKNEEPSISDLRGAETSNEFTVASDGVVFTYKDGEFTQVTIKDKDGRTITADVVDNKVSSEGIASEVSSVMGTTVNPEDEGVSNLTNTINTALENLAQQAQAEDGKNQSGKTGARGAYDNGPSL